jgi:hypothetical protein
MHDLRTLQRSRIAAMTSTRQVSDLFIQDSAFARILIIMTLGAFEALFKVWLDEAEFAQAFEGPAAKKANKPNKERGRDLAAALRTKGAQIDDDLVDDFVALRLIRNTLTHSEWQPRQLEFVRSRGFSGTATDLGTADWHRTKAIAIDLLRCIGQAEVGPDTLVAAIASDDPAPHLDSVGDFIVSLRDESLLDYLPRISQPGTIAHANLRSLATWLTKRPDGFSEKEASVARTIFAESWLCLAETVGLEPERVEASTGTLERLVSIGAFPSTPFGVDVPVPDLDQLRGEGTNLAGLRAAIESCGEPPNGRLTDDDLPDAVARELVQLAIRGLPVGLAGATVEALRMGRKAHDICANLSTARLAARLRDESATDFNPLAQQALAAWRLARTWYSWLNRSAQGIADIRTLADELDMKVGLAD